MSPPRSIQVGPFLYDVDVSGNASTRLDGDHGETDFNRLVFRLHRDRVPMVLRETLLHEVIHAASAVAGLDVELGQEVDEKIARRLAPVLLDVLRRNGRFVSFLLEKP